MRPELTPLEAKLLNALQIMKLWVRHGVESNHSGMGESWQCLQRDLNIACSAIEEATGGCES